MAIKQLTEEQIRTWTVEQKDRWWLDNVYRGNMRQLTLRAALSGMLIGGVLSVTNLYVGMKTGWTLGIGITSVILAFSFFKVLSSVGLANEFTVLENNCMQSIATAAGYMTAPLTSSLAAYMMITDTVIPMWITIVWTIAISILGVLFAFPLKRRFINDEQHPFPEGRAAGIVMDALHTSDASVGVFKAKILVIVGLLASLIEIFKSTWLFGKLKIAEYAIPRGLEEWVYKVFDWHPNPSIRGTPLPELGIRLEPDHVMMAAGGLMGIRAAGSLYLGAIVNYCIVVPWIIERFPGDIKSTVDAGGLVHYGFRNITTWALWGGVAMLTTASLFAFFSKPKMIFNSFSGLLKKKRSEDDCLRHIELPLSAFIIGIPIIGAFVVYLANHFFSVEIWHGIIAIPLVFVFTIIGANSTAITSTTPTGALGKLTQLSFGFLAPGQIKTNIITASITAEVASNASNLLMDIKPGYMLGAKPRQQALGHVLGIFAGAVAAVPIFYNVFLRNSPSTLITEEYPMPAGTVWRAVAEVLTKGVDQLPRTAVTAIVIGAVMGIVMEMIVIASRRRIPFSPVAFGLATVITYPTCQAMFLGALFFWVAGQVFRRKEKLGYRVLVENLEPICAGLIAGGSLTGIALIILEFIVFPESGAK